LHGLVKRWLEELNDDKEETPQAVFVFRVPIIKSVNQISCNIYPAADQIIDGFPYCQVIEIIYATSEYSVLDVQQHTTEWMWCFLLIASFHHVHANLTIVSVIFSFLFYKIITMLSMLQFIKFFCSLRDMLMQNKLNRYASAMVAP
jgi:hypothetical protein